MSSISELNLKPMTSTTSMERGLQSGDHSKMAKAAKEFEAVFMDIVMQSMRATVPDSELLDGGESTKTFQQMLDKEYGQMMTKTGKGMGLADAIMRQMSANHFAPLKPATPVHQVTVAPETEGVKKP